MNTPTKPRLPFARVWPAAAGAAAVVIVIVVVVALRRRRCFHDGPP